MKWPPCHQAAVGTLKMPTTNVNGSVWSRGTAGREQRAAGRGRPSPHRPPPSAFAPLQNGGAPPQHGAALPSRAVLPARLVGERPPLPRPGRRSVRMRGAGGAGGARSFTSAVGRPLPVPPFLGNNGAQNGRLRGAAGGGHTELGDGAEPRPSPRRWGGESPGRARGEQRSESSGER